MGMVCWSRPPPFHQILVLRSVTCSSFVPRQRQQPVLSSTAIPQVYQQNCALSCKQLRRALWQRCGSDRQSHSIAPASWNKCVRFSGRGAVALAAGTDSGQRRISVKSIGGNGDCLFSAIAQGHQYAMHGAFLRASEEREVASELRAAVCKELSKRKADMEPFIGPVESYVESMSKTGVWGGEPELAMAVHCLRRPIHVYQPHTAGLQAIARYGEDDYIKNAPISLLYNGLNHYDLMLIDPSS